MTSQYQIKQTATAIFPGGYQSGVLVYNPGTNSNTVYIGNDTTVSASTGFPVAPGTSLEWEQDVPLYAISPTELETITVDTDATSLTSASDVAVALIDSGLAGDIATAINAIGVPPVDQPNPIPFTVTGAGGYPVAGPFSVTEYASMEVSINVTTPSGTQLGKDIWWVEVTYDNGPDTPLIVADTITGQSQGSATLVLPTYGSRMTISAGIINNVSGATYTIAGTATLSMRERSPLAFVNNLSWGINNYNDGNAFSPPGIYTNNSVTTQYPSYRRGLCSIAFEQLTTGGSASNSLVLYDSVGGAGTACAIWAILGFSTAARAVYTTQVNIRQQPILGYTNNATSGTYTGSYAQVAI